MTVCMRACLYCNFVFFGYLKQGLYPFEFYTHELRQIVNQFSAWKQSYLIMHPLSRPLLKADMSVVCVEVVSALS